MSVKAFITRGIRMALLVCLCGKMAYAQSILNKKISLQADDESLRNVLSQIKTKADVKFVYSSNHIAMDTKISALAKDEELGSVLNKVLGQLDIKYIVNDGFIILK